MPDAPANPIGGIIQSLPINTMFAAPLMAALDCHTAACARVAEYIDKIGFNADKSVRMVRFAYSQSEVGADGNATGKSITKSIDIPYLAVAPLPVLGVDKVTVDFELQVDTSDSSSSSTEASATLSGKAGFAWWSVSFSGSVSHKSEQTRKTDTRSKYTVHMEASRQETPEGLQRVLEAILNAVTKPVDAAKAPALGQGSIGAGAPAPAAAK
jgi:hypothetical protein